MCSATTPQARQRLPMPSCGCCSEKTHKTKPILKSKKLGSNGEPEHGLEHMVEAILELEDGQPACTEKSILREVDQEARFCYGRIHTGIPRTTLWTAFRCRRKNMIPALPKSRMKNIFRLLTDPRYFNEVLHWQRRREILLEVCGDVSDAEVIASKADLSKLADILGKSDHRATQEGYPGPPGPR